MSKDVFLYELKAYIKFPVILLGIWLLTAIGCGIAVPVSGDAGAEEAFRFFDMIAELSVYILFLFLFFFSVYRTAAYDRLYAKVNRDSMGVLGARMLCNLICMGGVTLAFLLGGTIVDVLFKASHSLYYSTMDRRSVVFSLYRRNPLYFLFFLSTSASSLIVFACGTVIFECVRAAKDSLAKVVVGIICTLIMVLLVFFAIEAIDTFRLSPTLGMNDFFNYPIPRNLGWETWGGKDGPVCFIAWDIFNLPELIFAAAFIAAAFVANIVCRRREQK